MMTASRQQIFAFKDWVLESAEKAENPENAEEEGEWNKIENRPFLNEVQC